MCWQTLSNCRNNDKAMKTVQEQLLMTHLGEPRSESSRTMLAEKVCNQKRRILSVVRPNRIWFEISTTNMKWIRRLLKNSLKYIHIKYSSNCSPYCRKDRSRIGTSRSWETSMAESCFKQHISDVRQFHINNEYAYKFWVAAIPDDVAELAVDLAKNVSTPTKELILDQTTNHHESSQVRQHEPAGFLWQYAIAVKPAAANTCLLGTIPILSNLDIAEL